MKLSKNFWLEEFTKSMTATRLGIKNIPNVMQVNKLKKLCENVLQKVRDHYGKPIKIHSGFRHPELNKHIGGSESTKGNPSRPHKNRTSQHCNGEAADFEVEGVDNKEVAEWLVWHDDFDQLILEFYEDGCPDSGWVHVSYVSPEKNRGQVLRAYKDGKKTKYTLGLE